MKVFPGSILLDRYHLLASIGEGGFAAVYRAYDLELEREVAVKVLKRSDSTEELARFQREAKLLGQLAHPNIVSIYSFGILDDNTPFLVMEYLQGKSLQQLLEQSDSLEYDILIKLLAQICAGLSYAHKSGIIHRDLSPSNIFLLGTGTDAAVKLLDFGLSRLSDANSEAQAKLTKTGFVVGNPLYVSPEAVRGKTLDQRSDLYSLGCILYQCLSGAPPFLADSPAGLVYLQSSSYPPEPATKWPDEEKARSLKTIILRCLQKDPQDRFQSADELYEAALAQSDLSSSVRNRWQSKSNSTTKNQLIWKALSVSVAFALIICSIAYVFDFLVSAVFKTVPPSQNQLLIGLEERLLQFSQTAKKGSASVILLDHLSRSYSLAKDNSKALDAKLKAAELLYLENQSKPCLNELSDCLELTRSLTDNRQMADYLSRIWKELQEFRLHNRELSVEFFVLQKEALKQMLSCGRTGKAELRRCFDTILDQVKTSKVSDEQQLKPLLASLSLYVRNSHTKVDDEEIWRLGFLDGLGRENNCVEEANELLRDRISSARYTGEDGPQLMTRLASHLYDSAPQEVRSLYDSALVQLKKDGKIRQFNEVSAAQAQFCLHQHEYDQAWRLSQDGLKTTIADPGTLFKFRCVEIAVLFHRNETKKMEMASRAMLEELWQTMNLSKQGIMEVSRFGLTVNAGGVSKNLADPIVVEGFQIRWLDGLKCLLQSKQLSLANKQAELFLSTLQSRKWKLSHVVADGLIKLIRQREIDSELQGTIEKILRASPE